MASAAERAQTIGNNASPSVSIQRAGTVARLATADVEDWTDDDTDVSTASDENAVERGTVDLQTLADSRRTFELEDTQERIENTVSSRHCDTLKENSENNTLTGGKGDNTKSTNKLYSKNGQQLALEGLSGNS